MPNWSANSLMVVAKTDEQKSLMCKAIQSAFNFTGQREFINVFLPRPADQEENWYDWNVKNWGTKWDTTLDSVAMKDAYVRKVKEDGNVEYDQHIVYTLKFETAWAPPEGLYHRLAELGYELEASYCEGGMNFYGTYSTTEEGELTDDFHQSFSEDLRQWCIDNGKPHSQGDDPEEYPEYDHYDEFFRSIWGDNSPRHTGG